MKPGILLHLRSYFSEKILHEEISESGKALHVEINSGRLILNSENVNYSFGRLHDVFRKTFSLLRISGRKTDSVLLLGLGAGSVPAIFRNEYGGEKSVTGIESDQKVLEIGRRFFGLNEYKNLEIIHADACEFIHSCEKKFDLVIVDLFIDDKVPACAETEEFFIHLMKVAAPGGLVLYNRLGFREDLAQESLAFHKRMKQVNPELRYLRVINNYMLYVEKA